MLRVFMRPAADARGFSLVEVVVVILVIAILGAIATPVFLSQRKKAWIAQSQSTLKNAGTAMESYAAGNNGAFTADVSRLEEEGFNGSPYVALTVSLDNGGYCLKAVHAELPADDEWFISSLKRSGRPTSSDSCLV
ncbi:MAG: prepilin-type N-terminal cleavage/methylation domain-containing protein [Actinomycetota bacterium]